MKSSYGGSKPCLCGCGGIPSTGADYMQGHWKRSPEGAAKSAGLSTQHGFYKTRTYNIWVNMLQRCNNEKVPHYERYGGRGITVCERWNNFNNFLTDMGECPHKLTLERKDNMLGYSPDNCRWATTKEQNNNTRVNRMVEVDGELVSMAEAANILNIPYGTVARRTMQGLPLIKRERTIK